jgi:hypothetical protein
LLERYTDGRTARLPERLQGPAEAILSRLVTSGGTRNIVSEPDLIEQTEKAENIEPAVTHNALTELTSGSRLVNRQYRGETAFYDIVSEFLIPWILRKRIERQRRRDIEQAKRKQADAEARLAHETKLREEAKRRQEEAEAQLARETRLRNRSRIWACFATLFAIIALIAGFSAGFYAWMAVKGEREARRQGDIAEEQKKDAERERAKAEEQTKEAKRQRAIAEGQTEEVKRQRAIAEEQTEEAKRQRATAEGQTEEAKRQRTIAEEKMGLAETATEKAVRAKKAADRIMRILLEMQVTVSRILPEARNVDRMKEIGANSAEVINYFETHPPEANDRDALRAKGVALTLQGDALLGKSRQDHAVEKYRAALKIDQQLQKHHPNNTTYQNDIAIDYSKIGDALRARTGLRDLREALESYHRGLAITYDLIRYDPENVKWQNNLSILQNNFSEARAMVEKVRDNLRQLKKLTGLTAEQQRELDLIEADLHKMGKGGK